MTEETELKLQELVIEKDVPVKERYPRNAFTALARKMEIGDSIWSADGRVINGIMTALNKLGFSATTRTEKKGDVDGRRLWRVEPRKKAE